MENKEYTKQEIFKLIEEKIMTISNSIIILKSEVYSD